VFLSGTVAAWRLFVYPILAAALGIFLGVFAMAGSACVDLLLYGAIFWAVLLLPVSMLFSAIGWVYLAVFLWGAVTFWLREERRAMGLLAVCLAAMAQSINFAEYHHMDTVGFWIRLFIAIAIPVGTYAYTGPIRTLRYKRLLDKMDEGRIGPLPPPPPDTDADTDTVQERPGEPKAPPRGQGGP